MASDDPRIGSVCGNFRLLRKVGEGGMGVVYEAEHHTIGRRAAVKVMHAEFAKNDEYAKRFLNEARAVNIIRHPGLVEIFEFGQETDGSLYIVMEFLEGQSLFDRYVQPAVRPKPVDAARIGEQAARALAAAHEKNVVHRDLKPENLMLVPDPVRPTEDRVKVLDFGIAKVARRSAPDAQARDVGKRAGRTGAGVASASGARSASGSSSHASQPVSAASTDCRLNHGSSSPPTRSPPTARCSCAMKPMAPAARPWSPSAMTGPARLSSAALIPRLTKPANAAWRLPGRVDFPGPSP